MALLRNENQFGAELIALDFFTLGGRSKKDEAQLRQ